MNKFRRLYELLVKERLVEASNVHRPEPAGRDWLALAHTSGYVNGVLNGTLDEASIRRIGLPMGPGIVRRSLAAVGGTVLTARLALRHGVAFNTAGGSHHAFSDHGSGYCVFNDVAVASRALLAAGEAGRILVVDLDVHQGDGTAEILSGENRAFTFSMHCADNFPRAKQKSHRDVALAAGTGDAKYLEVLKSELDTLLDAVAPDLVMYNAGVDPHRGDRLGKLDLTDAGLAGRERLVLETCRRVSVPVACVVGGGYHADTDVVVRRHMIIHRAAQGLGADSSVSYA